MSINLGDYEKSARAAVRYFWQTRDAAALKQKEGGRLDQGSRGSVTSGKNMDGFVEMVCKVIKANGLKSDSIHFRKKVVTLPGFFRPTKSWDLLVMNDTRLIAAIEFKSQVGSFGNNLNNRAEEAIGTAVDLATAFQEGAFGNQTKPFVGWMMLLEDCEKSRRAVKAESPHFSVFNEFKGASYADRYHLLCQKLVLKQHYDATAFVLSSRSRAKTGDYTELDSMTGLETFLLQLGARVAAETAIAKKSK